MRVLNVGAARRLSAVASLCMVGLVVSSCGMVTITPKNAGEPTAGTLTGLPSPAEMAATDQPSTANESAQTSAKEQSANEQASKQTPLQQGARLPREVRERRGVRVHRGWVAHRLVCACCGCVRALLGRCVPCVLIHHKWLCKVTAASQCPLGCSAVAVGLVYVLF